ncbi:hypothetical protein PINS_up004759 [Pythium insidiosum]|nr:hypothetical protein PINS_up004759 [Pythium insidiosum]
MLIDSFTFNLHHISKWLHRTLAYAGIVDKQHRSSDSGSVLLTLGKLHQCWISEAALIFLDAFSLAPRNEGTPTDDAQKIVGAVRIISEKQFSVPIPLDNNASRLSQVSFLVHHVLGQHPSTTDVERTRIEEIVTSGLSATMPSAMRRKDQAIGAGTRIDTIVGAMSSIVSEHPFLQLIQHATPSDSERIQQRLHLRSTLGLYHVLSLTHALKEHQNFVLTRASEVVFRRSLEWASRAEGFVFVDLMSAASMKGELERAFLAAGTTRSRVLVWTDVERLQSRGDAASEWEYVEMELEAIAKGHTPLAFFSSLNIRNSAVVSCASAQSTLRVLTKDDVTAHFRAQVADNFRVCVLFGSSGSLSLVETLRNSPAFQYLEADQPGETTMLRYCNQVSEQAASEIAGAIQLDSAAIASVVTACGDRFQEWLQQRPQLSPWHQMETFLSFATNLVVRCQRESTRLNARHQEKIAVVNALDSVSTRWQELIACVRRWRSRIEELERWQAELGPELQEMRRQLEEMSTSEDLDELMLRDASPEALAEFVDVSTQQRTREKLERHLWALKAMIEEYGLSIGEFKTRIRDAMTEQQEWEPVIGALPDITNRYRKELIEIKAHSTPDAILSFGLSQTATPVFGDAGSSHIESHSDSLRDEHTGLPEAEFIRDLWRYRFPFVNHSAPVIQSLELYDQVADRVPILVDDSGLLQHVLVHLFNAIPLFSGDVTEDRREKIVSGVTPAIIQCDDGIKMCRRLQDAMEKEVPTLLVGVRPDQLAVIYRLCGNGPRRPLLAQMTMDAWAQQRKLLGSGGNRATGGRASSVVLSAMAMPSRGSNPTNRAAMSLLKSLPSKADPAPVEDASRSRRRPTLMTVGQSAVSALQPSKGSGFQLFAVTSQFSKFSTRDDDFDNSKFALFPVEWETTSIELFFNELFVRKLSPKLHRELIDLRMQVLNANQRVADSENALRLISQLSRSALLTSERPQLVSCILELQRTRDQCLNMLLPTAQHRLQELERRRDAFAPLAKALARLVLCCHRISPLSTVPGLYCRHFRSMEQLVDMAVAAINANDGGTAWFQASHRDLNVDRHAFKRLFRHILLLTMAGLRSSSHQCIVLYAMRAPFNNSGDFSAFVELLRAVRSLTCTAQGNASVHDQPAAKNKPPPLLEMPSPPSIRRTSTTSSVLSPMSAADRLRRKVRACSLLFEQMTAAREKTAKPATTETSDTRARGRSSTTNRGSQKMMTMGVTNPTSSTSPNKSSVIVSGEGAQVARREELYRAFRSSARVVKTLWCEWKLAAEDHRLELEATLRTFGLDIPLESRPRRLAAASAVVSIRVWTIDELITTYQADAVQRDAPHALDSARLHLALVLFPHKLQAVMYSSSVDDQDGTIADLLYELPTMKATLGLGGSGHDGRTLQTKSSTPLLDIAWRRDDLVHLPDRVLIYPSWARHQMEALLLSARSLTQLRIITVHAFDEAAVRERIVLSISNKERFAVEVLSSAHMERVIALVSQMINMHALLCVPEWYIVCSTAVFEGYQGSKLGMLRVQQLLDKDATQASLRDRVCECMELQGVSSHDDAVAFTEVICRVAETTEGGALIASGIEDAAFYYKTLVQASTDGRRLERLSRILVGDNDDCETSPSSTDSDSSKTLQMTTEEDDSARSFALRSDLQTLAKSWLEHSANSLVPERTATFLETATMSEVMTSLNRLATDVEKEWKSEMERRADSCRSGGATWCLWSWEREVEGSIRSLRMFCELLRQADTKNSDPELRAGYVPSRWLRCVFPQLAFLRDFGAISLPQLVVYLVSRVGFMLELLSNAPPPPSLNLAVFEDVPQMLQDVHSRSASLFQLDSDDVVLVISIQNASMEAESAVTTDVEAESQAPQSSVVVDLQDSLVSVLVQGLVLMERIDGSLPKGLWEPASATPSRDGVGIATDVYVDSSVLLLSTDSASSQLALGIPIFPAEDDDTTENSTAM